ADMANQFIMSSVPEGHAEPISATAGLRFMAAAVFCRCGAQLNATTDNTMRTGQTITCFIEITFLCYEESIKKEKLGIQLLSEPHSSAAHLFLFVVLLRAFIGLFAVHELLRMRFQLLPRVGVLLEERLQVRMFRQVTGIVNQVRILAEIRPDIFVLVEVRIPIAQFGL